MTELWVPGRLEFLGKHTDYAGGRSLLCPIDRGIRATVTPRNDARVVVRDAKSGEAIECTLDESARGAAGHWSAYPTTVVRRLARDFPDARTGADITFESNLPMAAGLSSSSALVVTTYLAIAAVNALAERASYRDNIRTREDLAEYVGCIENGAPFRAFPGDPGVGTLNGCEDQTAMLCGLDGRLVRYAFCPVRFEGVAALPPDHAFVVAVSGVVAEKTGGARESYNAVSRRARAAADAWRRSSGRDDATLGSAVAHAGPAAVRDAIARESIDGFTTAELLERFDQFVLESEILVPAADRALREGDLTALGAAVARSQAAAEQQLGNQIPETIALARLARELGATAASAFGGGFGGSVWALIAGAAAAPDFTRVWRDAYAGAFPAHAATATFFTTRASGPAATAPDTPLTGDLRQVL